MEGKLGLIFASTGVIDLHHTVISQMGDRYLLTRLAPVRDGQFARALQHAGAGNKTMRKEFAEAVRACSPVAAPNLARSASKRLSESTRCCCSSSSCVRRSSAIASAAKLRRSLVPKAPRASAL